MTPEEAFFTLHSDLLREGPGDEESLGWALSQARPPRDGRVLDAGCGPGADVEGLLAAVPEGQVVAVDQHRPYIDELAARLDVDARLLAVTGDMMQPEGMFDLIWCAGAIYHVGVTEALRRWRPHLKPGGRVAFSEIAWRVDNPPLEARDFWQSYPAMTDREGVLARVEATGWRVLADRWLPEAGWAAYYEPLAARIAHLRAEALPALADVLTQAEAEISLWRRHGDSYGYLQVVAEPAA
ncbi:methyltransferase domain-containing protein [Cereibacter sphaeroides]|uniref:class I SAM-dependent methyltransferase n=1 Tax=Cereibacter sphaeroides TaxID=1063 RepID=UPI001F2D4CC7|nr:class I SAM-dependent methyltransferase [Cereibacter sphaeroides]MCE6961727.1 methyltransferase domain-containing protein [Cereibacter sphaeroides]MCE6970503.1 methyltransferase domain-containing protein [Cereibacter sphaeroides]MCE6975077.1 methyltransferase domain-containing protein [Cereibacter sphaeroides]